MPRPSGFVGLSPQAQRPPALDVAAWVSRELPLVIGELGETSLFERLRASLMCVTGFTTGGAFVHHREGPPTRLCLWGTQPRAAVIHDCFIDHFYKDDPLLYAIERGLCAGCYTPAMYSPQTYTSTAFYRDFLSQTDITDEIDFVVPTADGALVVWLGRNELSGGFSLQELSGLTEIEPIVRSLLAKHLALRSAGNATPRPDEHRRRLDRTRLSFGSSILTVRERSVLQWMLNGYTTPAITRRLGIAEGTVKNHRKSIYRKLDVSSQAELLSLFLEAMAYTDATGHADPLVPLNQPRSRTDVASQAQ